MFVAAASSQRGRGLIPDAHAGGVKLTATLATRQHMARLDGIKAAGAGQWGRLGWSRCRNAGLGLRLDDFWLRGLGLFDLHCFWVFFDRLENVNLSRDDGRLERGRVLDGVTVQSSGEGVLGLSQGAAVGGQAVER